MQCYADRFGYLGLMSLALARMTSDNSYLWAWKLERNETLHNCTYMYNMASYCSMCNIEVTEALNVTSARLKVWSTRHNAVRHDGQPTRHTISGCDELTGSQLKHFTERQ